MSDFAANPEAGDEDTGPVTIYDIQSAEDSKVRLRALPRLTRQALRLAWAAGPRDFMISTDDDALGRGWTNGCTTVARCRAAPRTEPGDLRSSVV